jgi:hypothetical protein
VAEKAAAQSSMRSPKTDSLKPASYATGDLKNPTFKLLLWTPLFFFWHLFLFFGIFFVFF